MDNSNVMRMPFQTVQNIHNKGLVTSKSDKQKQIISDALQNHKDHKEPKSQQVEDLKISLSKQDDSVDSLEKDQLISLVLQYKKVLGTCFDENDKLRERISKLEALYSMAQDEIESRDQAIQELAALLQNEELQKCQ